jgi:DNA-binding HxlR family transcriptional regulator
LGKAVDMSVRMDRVLLDQIAGQWNLLILSTLCDYEGRARFNVLKRGVQVSLKRCLPSVCDNWNEVDWWHVGS